MKTTSIGVTCPPSLPLALQYPNSSITTDTTTNTIYPSSRRAQAYSLFTENKVYVVFHISILLYMIY